MYDVIIIGAGPAGISASLYTSRANLKTLIIYKEEKSSLLKTTQIDNYYGFENGINGEELYKIGVRQAKNLGIELKQEEVIKIEKEDKFVVETMNNKYESKSVILATGISKNKPNIIGLDKFEGRGISYCAVCDGFFFKNKKVAVIGNGDFAISETTDLQNIVKSTTILTNGAKIPEYRANNVNINSKEIESIDGENKVEKINFKDKTSIEVDGIFIAQGVAGSAEFARKIGARIEQNKIITNNRMETTVEGLYACGDCTGGTYQIAKAVYEGMTAGTESIKYIKRERKE